MRKSSSSFLVFFIICGFIVPLSIFIVLLSSINKNNISKKMAIITPQIIVADAGQVTKPKFPKRLETPDMVRGIYLTGYTLTNETPRNNLIQLAEKTEINTFVIDIKDSNGKLMFTPNSEVLQPVPISKIGIENDLHKKILSELEEKQIYTIARITTFQDNTAVKTFPELALKNKNGRVWKNWQGIGWLDMTNKESWKIPVEQAKEAVLLGYDEIQFDYIRFPSDGNLWSIKYENLPPEKEKYEILSEFYEYIDEELKETDIPISIDLFGLTYEKWKDKNYDLNIGQRLVDASKYFDYISPMVYPSHYPSGYLGIENPAANPYQVIDWAMKAGNSILGQATSTTPQTRPWLQDFDIGAIYTANLVRAQIDASEKNNASGWILWNPRNRYTTGALKPIK